MKPMTERDTRITPLKRRIVLDIDDYTPIPFSMRDEEWIAENVEDLLRQRYDVTVEGIHVEDR